MSLNERRCDTDSSPIYSLILRSCKDALAFAAADHRRTVEDVQCDEGTPACLATTIRYVK